MITSDKAQPSRGLILEVTFFNCKSDNEPKPQIVTWPEFVESCKTAVIRTQKDGRLFSPAVFMGLRAKDNVESVSMLVLDYDHGADLERDVRVWMELAIAFFV